MHTFIPAKEGQVPIQAQLMNVSKFEEKKKKKKNFMNEQEAIF